MNGNSKVYAAFLDLSKAFDKVNHYILIDKLGCSRVSPVIVNIISEMYKKQYVHINFNGYVGESWLLKNGVRQGGIISPLLFNFYINDILNEISNLSVGCKLNTIRHNVQGYADDLTLLAPSIYGLQLLIDKMFVMLNDLCMKLNTEKSVCMVFKTKMLTEFNPVFHLNGKLMTVVNSVKYLGIELRSDLGNAKDIVRVEKSFLKQFYSIFRKFSSADKHILAFLFQSHCMSLYACELWDDIKGSNAEFKSLAINYYHKCIKKIMKRSWSYSNHEVCEEAELPILLSIYII
jgi:hypothetical protein